MRRGSVRGLNFGRRRKKINVPLIIFWEGNKYNGQTKKNK